MRIAYLNSHYPSLSHTFIEREVRALRALGVEIETFTVRAAGASGAIGDRHAEEAKRTFVLKPGAGSLVGSVLMMMLTRPVAMVRTLLEAQRISTPGLKARVGAVAYAIEAARLAREMGGRGLRHVHVHMANNAAAVGLLACAFDRRLTYSLTIHGSAEFFDVHRLNLKAKVERAVFVRGISDFGRAQFMAWSDPKAWAHCHVVHCGVDLSAFSPAPPRSWRELRILSVGRLEPIKGYPMLLDACAELSRRGADWRLEMVGSGKMEASLREQAARLGISERVRFTGAVSQEEIGEVYERNDVMVVSSFMEGVPVVLMEAMAKGLLVVSTAVGGVGELVQHERNGLLVPPGSARALAEALASIEERVDTLQSWRDAGRAKVLSEFSVDHTARGMKELFERYLADGAAVRLANVETGTEQVA